MTYITTLTHCCKPEFPALLGMNSIQRQHYVPCPYRHTDIIHKFVQICIISSFRFAIYLPTTSRLLHFSAEKKGTKYNTKTLLRGIFPFTLKNERNSTIFHLESCVNILNTLLMTKQKEGIYS